MAKRAEKISAQIEVIPAAPEQQSILANLLELYAHDFSEFHDIEVGADGRFRYKRLPLYWSEPGRHPFLVWVAGNPAGFALVKRGSEVSGDKNVWDMAEFFVMRKYRREGIGSQVAREVWSRFPGQWEVRVLEENVLAYLFWERAISGFTSETPSAVRVEKDGESWKLFSFESRRIA
jgi:predicted acetyltransferase